MMVRIHVKREQTSAVRCCSSLAVDAIILAGYVANCVVYLDVDGNKDLTPGVDPSGATLQRSSHGCNHLNCLVQQIGKGG